jgi:hypothetical protein
MDDYISKPIKMHVVAAVLERWLGQGRGDKPEPMSSTLAGEMAEERPEGTSSPARG